MRTGTPQAERIVHRLGFLSQGFANSVGLSASGSIWRQIIISWKNILALQWKAAVWSALTSHWLKNFAPVVGEREMCWNGIYLCWVLLVSGETSPWSLLPTAPHSRRLEHKWGKVLMGFPHTSPPGSRRDWVLLVQRKSSRKKGQENIHLIQNASPNVECKLCSQEGDGGTSPGWEAQTLCGWADALMSPGHTVCFAPEVNLFKQNLPLQR